MADNKRIAKNTLFLYVRMLLIMGINLYVSRVVLRELGAEDFGLYNVIGGVVVIFSFLNGALSAATSRFITFELGQNNEDRLSDVFSCSVIIHLLIALVIVLLSETIGLWLFYEKMTIPIERMTAAFWVFQISIITCVFSVTQVPYTATIIAHEQMKIYAYVGILEVILKLVVVYLIAISPIDKLIFYAILLCVLQIFVMMCYRLFCVKNYKESKFQFCKDKSLYKEMVVYAGSDLIGNISVMAQGQGINLLLNMFFGPIVNAARAIAYQVQGVVTQFSHNFMTAVRPQIIKLYAENRMEEMMQLVCQSSIFSFYLLWMLFLPLILESEYVLGLWLGEFPEHTSSFMILVLILCLIQSLKTPRTTIYQASGKILLPNLLVGTILCMAFPLAYVFLRLEWTPESSLWAVNISMIFSEIASICILRKYVDYSIKKYVLSVHGRCVLVVIISLILPCLLYDKFMEPCLLRLITTCLISFISIGITCFLIGMDRAMRKKILSMFREKLCKK